MKAIIWTPMVRRLLYTELVKRFGPYNIWASVTAPADAMEFNQFLSDFAKLVGAKSANAVLHQIEFAIQRKILHGGQAQNSILNKAAAFECGFITNHFLERCA